MQEYWDLTLQEIKDIIDSFERTTRRDKRQRIEEIFVLAEVVANRVLVGMNGKATSSDFLQPWHYYPGLFENLEEEADKAQEDAETQRIKAIMTKRAEQWNKKFKEKTNGP